MSQQIKAALDLITVLGRFGKLLRHPVLCHLNGTNSLSLPCESSSWFRPRRLLRNKPCRNDPQLDP